MECDFHGVVGAEAIGMSGYHSNLVVESFHHAVGYLAFGPELKNAQEEGLCPGSPTLPPDVQTASIPFPSPRQLKQPLTARPYPSQLTIEIFASTYQGLRLFQCSASHHR